MSTGDDWKDEAGEPLSELLQRAQRASQAGMSDAESAHLWETVRHRRPRQPSLRPWAVGVAAALLIAAGLTWLRRPAPIEIVKEVAFETVHDGKTVRFEMTVYREAEKEKRHAGKPSL
jgi:hypothetical protein